jgi:nitrite reductase/ring-hydroxylating ferredoxin subunit
MSVREETGTVDVGAVDEFEPGTVRIVLAGGRQIGVIKWHDGALYAVDNRCPHQAGPLCRGPLSPWLGAKPGAPGELVVDENRPVIACAWHRWEFDIATGCSVWDERYKVRTYPVEVVGERVLVTMRRRPRNG